MEEDHTPSKGDEYIHPSGVHEVVYAVVDGRILTVREYGDSAMFRMHNSEANYQGKNKMAIELPGPLEIQRNESERTH